MTNVFSWQNFVHLCPASFCTPILCDEKDICFFGGEGVGSRRCFMSSWNQSTSASLASVVRALIWITDVEWLALGTKQDHSVIFEAAPKYCSLDSF